MYKSANKQLVLAALKTQTMQFKTVLTLPRTASMQVAQNLEKWATSRGFFRRISLSKAQSGQTKRSFANSKALAVPPKPKTFSQLASQAAALYLVLSILSSNFIIGLRCTILFNEMPEIVACLMGC